MRFLTFLLISLAALHPSAHSQTASPAPGNSAAVPRPDSEPPDAQFTQSQTRFALYQQHLATTPRPIDIIFDGDSITDFWHREGQPAWDKNFANRRAFDFGISGDGTDHVLWRLAKGQVNGLDPKLISLMIGTNNLSRNTDEQIVEGIKTVVAEYQKLCPKATILLMGIFPRSQSPDDPVRARIKAINQQLAALADGRKIIYLDLADKFLEPDGTLSPTIMFDYLHLTPKGYELWAEAITPIVDKYCPKE